MESWQKAVSKKTKGLFKESAKNLFEAVISQTPVGQPDYWKNKPPKGYSGGLLKGNWQFTKNAPATGELDRKDKDGGATVALMSKGLDSVNFGKDFNFFLTNNLPYAVAIEEGGSPQTPPQGMVRGNLIRITDILNRKTI